MTYIIYFFLIFSPFPPLYLFSVKFVNRTGTLVRKGRKKKSKYKFLSFAWFLFISVSRTQNLQKLTQKNQPKAATLSTSVWANSQSWLIMLLLIMIRIKNKLSIIIRIIIHYLKRINTHIKWIKLTLKKMSRKLLLIKILIWRILPIYTIIFTRMNKMNYRKFKSRLNQCVKIITQTPNHKKILIIIQILLLIITIIPI